MPPVVSCIYPRNKPQLAGMGSAAEAKCCANPQLVLAEENGIFVFLLRYKLEITHGSLYSLVAVLS